MMSSTPRGLSSLPRYAHHFGRWMMRRRSFDAPIGGIATMFKSSGGQQLRASECT